MFFVSLRALWLTVARKPVSGQCLWRWLQESYHGWGQRSPPNNLIVWPYLKAAFLGESEGRGQRCRTFSLLSLKAIRWLQLSHSIQQKSWVNGPVVVRNGESETRFSMCTLHGKLFWEMCFSPFPHGSKDDLVILINWWPWQLLSLCRIHLIADVVVLG